MCPAAVAGGAVAGLAPACQTRCMVGKEGPAGAGSQQHSRAGKILPVSLQERGGWTIIRLHEASLMEPAVIEALGDHVELLVGEGKTRVILDFTEVQYISSTMIGVLVGARQSLVRKGGELILCALNDRLLELLRITRLHKVFVVEPTLDEAMSRAGIA